MRPMIGISCWQNPDISKFAEFFVPETYVQAIRQAGAQPVLVPYVAGSDEAAAVLDRLDGLLLSGGVDVDPLHWGEEPHRAMGRIDPNRDRSELLLSRHALASELPLFGICRGVQVMTVAAGGSLWQDLPAQVPASLKHDQEAPRWYPTHAVHVVPGSRIASWLGMDLRVNSFHHQAVRQVPAVFAVTASAPDGVIEALEHQTHPFAVGVQWHPEAMWDRENNYNVLFDEFVAAARGTAARRRDEAGESRQGEAGGNRRGEARERKGERAG